MRKLLTVTVVLLGLTACRQPKSKKDTKDLDFGAFTIETPSSWQKISSQGIDSYVGKIAIDSTDTIGFDLGAYSYPLTELEPSIFQPSDSESYKGLKPEQYIIVEDIRKVKDYDQFKKQNLLWDTIDGREVKIVYPRKAGKGITGVYIDSLWVSKDGIDKFNLYGEDLKPKNQKAFLEAIKTIKFHQLKGNTAHNISFKQ